MEVNDKIQKQTVLIESLQLKIGNGFLDMTAKEQIKKTIWVIWTPSKCKTFLHKEHYQ
jgi:hypothetical protein